MKQNHIGRRICSLMLSAVLVLQGGVYTAAEEVVTESDIGYAFSASEEDVAENDMGYALSASEESVAENDMEYAFSAEEDLAEEFLFLKELSPQMCGLGPFIPHQDTPFRENPAGSVETTLFMLGLIRLTLPDVLLPATTALGTLDPQGREKGISFGANVLMPNLSPSDVKKKYLLYDNKICTGDEAARCIECLKARIKKTGCEIVTDRGDHKGGYHNV